MVLDNEYGEFEMENWNDCDEEIRQQYNISPEMKSYIKNNYPTVNQLLETMEYCQWYIWIDVLSEEFSNMKIDIDSGYMAEAFKA
jgi:hypothetical protein